MTICEEINFANPKSIMSNMAFLLALSFCCCLYLKAVLRKILFYLLTMRLKKLKMNFLPLCVALLQPFNTPRGLMATRSIT